MSRTTIPRLALRLNSRSSLPVPSRAIEPPCRTLPLLRSQCASHTIRSFSISPQFQKKSNKTNKYADSPPSTSKAGQISPTEEAYDVSGLEIAILRAIEKLTHELGQLRGGSRMNPEIIEELKVQLGTGKEGKETVRLGDIAQVVPRGRMLNIVCGEEDHIKSITSAIASSPHSLTPLTPESVNPLTIQVPLPPPTGETRRAAVESAIKASERADKLIQTARQEHNKRLRKYELNKDVLPDDLQKAKKRMEEVIKKGHTEVKRITDGAKKVLESQ
ncbi:ribosome recycling factor [Dothidotthia symphoricarpi CBS 119687]|uniref:Ribosome recycling factor n=1 Tax=Dothidotthia symphoricarpi CBS 119687 TaxID=1392245 RepID=A0A6A6AEV9_9PLEO|nr:ribosome recycling factor [Dothidotthia symphoricarpi CBS 119687]KAF2130502.1 ribosome recycling factor [Dothidotthia symphoricarpi CBS 119687]